MSVYACAFIFVCKSTCEVLRDALKIFCCALSWEMRMRVEGEKGREKEREREGMCTNVGADGNAAKELDRIARHNLAVDFLANL